jgi:hypothetical protein
MSIFVELKNLTPAERAAIDCIGRHRKTDVKVGAGKLISTRMFNQLQRKGLVMWLNENRRTLMLTYPGERLFTKMHPHSKYRIR